MSINISTTRGFDWSVLDAERDRLAVRLKNGDIYYVTFDADGNLAVDEHSFRAHPLTFAGQPSCLRIATLCTGGAFEVIGPHGPWYPSLALIGTITAVRHASLVERLASLT